MSVPLVSICCITYNHEPYIRECIEGFLMQKTTFQFEVLIHDDASTDNTANIIREYEAKYPNIIKPIYQTENQYSKGVKISSTYNYPRAKGKYIAICEGDDYWTDPLKLQKQVNLLESNQDLSLCFHAHENYNKSRDESIIKRPKKIPYNNIYTIKDAILGGGSFMATCSMLFRNILPKDNPEWIKKSPVGDLPLMLYLASKGKIGYIDEVMSVYNVMVPGSWTSKMTERKKINKHRKDICIMWDNFDKWTNFKYHSLIIEKKIRDKMTYLKSDLKKILFIGFGVKK